MINDFNSSIVDSLLKSKFIFHDIKTLEIDNAVIIWKNFSGKVNRFGNSNRHFNVVINKEVADELTKKGVLVHPYFPEEKNVGDPLFYSFDVKINFESNYPPLVTVYTEYNGIKTHNAIGLDSLAALDTISFESADCIVNIYSSTKNPGKASAYLRKLNVIHRQVDEFGGKYSKWDNSDQEQKQDVANTTKDAEENSIDGDDSPKKEGKNK